jgi:hypothetical protein
VQQAERERLTALRQRRQAKLDLSKLKREAHKRRTAASRADRKRSKRGLAKKDYDARSEIRKVLLAMGIIKTPTSSSWTTPPTTSTCHPSSAWNGY